MDNDVKRCPFCAEDIKAAAIVCKHCGRDITGDTVVGPQHSTGSQGAISGSSNKDGKKKGKGCVWLILALIFIFAVIYWIVANTTITTEPVNRATDVTILNGTPTPTLAQYKNNIQNIDAQELIRNTEKYIGAVVSYQGEVTQVLEKKEQSQTSYNIFLAIDGDYDHTIVFVDSHNAEEGTRILEDDNINALGIVLQRHEFESIQGKQIIIPVVETLEIVVNDEDSSLSSIGEQSETIQISETTNINIENASEDGSTTIETVPSNSIDVQTGDVQWSVLDATNEGSKIDTLSASGVFVVVRVNIKNTGTQPVTYFGANVVDNSGKEYSYVADALPYIIDEEACDVVTINPNEQRICTMVYDVQESANAIGIILSNLDLIDKEETTVELTGLP